MAVAPIIGFHDGIFGPGVGSFFMLACVILLGQHLIQAVCNSKLLNAACNLGAQLGARCAVHFGPRLVKPLLVCVCCIMALKLMLDSGNPLGEWLHNQFF